MTFSPGWRFNLTALLQYALEFGTLAEEHNWAIAEAQEPSLKLHGRFLLGQHPRVS
jgi:hypothetical protein